MVVNKWLFIGIGSAVLVAGGVTFGVILANTNNVKATTFAIEGTWQVFEQGNTGQQPEFMVFKDGKVQDFIDGKVQRESTFKVTDANATFTNASISFPEWNIGYAFERRSVTMKIFALYGDHNVSFSFVRVKDDEYLNRSTFSATDFQNKTFDVILHANTIKEQKEYLVFEETVLSFYRDDKIVVDHAEFQVKDSLITAPGFKFYITAITEKTYLLVEITNEPLTGERAYWPWEWSLR